MQSYRNWVSNSKKSTGRLNKRWKDDVVEVGSNFWKRKAKNSENKIHVSKLNCQAKISS